MAMSQHQMEWQSERSWRDILCSQDRPDDPDPQCATCGTKENLTICDCQCAYHCCLAHRVMHHNKGHRAVCEMMASLEQVRVQAEQEYLAILEEEEGQRNVLQNVGHVLRVLEIRTNCLNAAHEGARLCLKMDTGTAARKANAIYRQIRGISEYELGAWDKIWIFEMRMGNDITAWEFTAMGAAVDLPQLGMTGSRVGKFLIGPVEQQFKCSVLQPPAEILRYDAHTVYMQELGWIVNLLILKLKALSNLWDIRNSETLGAMGIYTQSGQYLLPAEILVLIQQNLVGELISTSDNIVAAIRIGDRPALGNFINTLTNHVLELAEAVDVQNPCFWPVFLSSRHYMFSEAFPSSRSPTSVPDRAEEAVMMLRQTFHAFVEGNMLEWIHANVLAGNFTIQGCQQRWAHYRPNEEFMH